MFHILCPTYTVGGEAVVAAPRAPRGSYRAYLITKIAGLSRAAPPPNLRTPTNTRVQDRGLSNEPNMHASRSMLLGPQQDHHHQQQQQSCSNRAEEAAAALVYGADRSASYKWIICDG